MRISSFRVPKPSLSVAAFALAAPLALACGTASDPERVGATTQAIIDGQASTDAQDAVVLIIHVSDTGSGGIGSCTGTLVAPNLVLTARHCVSTISEQAFGCDEDGNPLPAGNPGAIPGADKDPGGFYIYTGKKSPFGSGLPHKPNGTGKKIFHDGAKVLCSHDLALILLQADIPDAKILPMRVAADPEAGEMITAIGWGLTEAGQQPAARLQRKSIPVLKVGPFTSDGVFPPVPPNDFLIGEGICSGDSGGPAFAEATSSVIGVVSRGGNGTKSTSPGAQCIGDKTRNNYTKVAPFKAVIDKAFAASGHEPWYEGRPDPRLAKGGETCDDDALCQSNVCSKGACLEPCAEDDTCPSGATCTPNDVQKACVPNTPPGGGGGSSGCVVAPAESSTARGPFTIAAFLALVGLSARRKKR